MIIVLGEGCGRVANAYAKAACFTIAFLPAACPDEPFHHRVIVTRTPAEAIKAVVTHAVLGDTLKICMYERSRSDPRKLKPLADGLTEVHTQRQFSLKTVARWSFEWHQNAIRNLPAMAKLNQATDLKLNSPAIIVGPGPSLDRNIATLKQVEGRAVIIALQRVARRLVDEGIIPDIVVAVDAAPLVLGHLEGLPWDKISLLALEQSCDPGLFSLPARIVWYVEHGGHVSFTQRIFRVKCAFPGGGTVAASAFSLALAWGCKQIATVGIDLAYSGGERYSSGETAPRAASTLLRSWDGRGVVHSSIDLVATHTWLTAAVRKVRGHVECYNCTEGGAYIDGMKHLKLVRFLRRLGDKVDVKAAIDEMPAPDASGCRENAATITMDNDTLQAELDRVCLLWRSQ